MSYCDHCMRKLTHHEIRICRRCKCAMERAEWLHTCGLDMDKYNMLTTGNVELDNTINKYR